MNNNHNLLARLKEKQLGVVECEAFVHDFESKLEPFVCYFNGLPCRYQSHRQKCQNYQELKRREKANG